MRPLTVLGIVLLILGVISFVVPPARTMMSGWVALRLVLLPTTTKSCLQLLEVSFAPPVWYSSWLARGKRASRRSSSDDQ
jgi:hypothetical protein